MPSTFVAVTDPYGAIRGTQPVPHRCWLEVDGKRVYGLEPFERKLGMQNALRLAAAVAFHPSGTFMGLHWDAR